MLKGVVLGAGLTIIIAIIGAYTLLQLGLIPANADSKPGRLETWMAETSLDSTLRREAPPGNNPVELTSRISSAESVFSHRTARYVMAPRRAPRLHRPSPKVCIKGRRNWRPMESRTTRKVFPFGRLSTGYD